jgi:hypothetical protein
MKYTVEMGSNAMIYIPTFINTGSAIHRQYGDSINLILIFFEIRKVG